MSSLPCLDQLALDPGIVASTQPRRGLIAHATQSNSRKVTLRRSAEIVNLDGVHVISKFDWSSCHQGWTLFQLEPEFYPELDLLLFGRVGHRVFPILLMSNGHAVIYGPREGSLVKFNLSYSLSFGGRISLLNGFGAADTRFRYPSISKHREVVVLSGVAVSSHRTQVTCNPLSPVQEILLGRLPITYYPIEDQWALVSGSDRLYVLRISTDGCLTLFLNQEDPLPMRVGCGSYHPNQRIRVSLDSVVYVAYNTLAPLELRDHALLVNSSNGTNIKGKISVSSTCGIVFFRGALVGFGCVNTCAGANTHTKYLEIGQLPEHYRPSKRVSKLIPVKHGSLGRTRIVIRPDGMILLKLPLQFQGGLHDEVIFMVDLHYFRGS